MRPALYCSFLLVCLASLLGACALVKPVSTPKPASSIAIHQQHISALEKIQHFSLKGKLGVVTSPHGFSGGLHWQHDSGNDQMEIFSPFGSKVADIAETADEVVLTDQHGKRLQAKDVETLTEASLGWRLPLVGLSDWALGRPAKTRIDYANWDEFGRLIQLKQDNWEISYADYSEIDGYDLPGKIIVKNANVSLKLLVEQWSGL